MRQHVAANIEIDGNSMSEYMSEHIAVKFKTSTHVSIKLSNYRHVTCGIKTHVLKQALLRSDVDLYRRIESYV